MKNLPSSSLQHVVKNEEGHYSLWPDFRRGTLPAGWVFVGFSGPRDECLRKITALHVTVAAPTAPRSPARSSRATAVPFPRPSAPWRLIIFPHAGSGASYYHFLARAFKDDAPELHVVQYPGREMRVKEAPLTSMDAMTSTLLEELGPVLAGKPCVFFGHSMGALTAFELTRRLSAANATLPRHLFLSGRQPPQIPGPVLHVEALDDASFLEAVGRRYNALPPELLANREILEIVLPSLRADFTLMDQYAYREASPLDVPFTLLNGVDDPWIHVEALAGWQVQTKHPLEQRMFPGGHFYLSAAAAEIRSTVLSAVGTMQVA